MLTNKKLEMQQKLLRKDIKIDFEGYRKEMKKISFQLP